MSRITGSISLSRGAQNFADSSAFHGTATRVLIMVPVIWALNLLDLVFTILGGKDRNFVELNPLASHLTAHGQVLFKLSMLLLFTVIFIVLRRHRAAELGCFLLLAIYGTLAVVWLGAFHFLLSPQYFAQLF